MYATFFGLKQAPFSIAPDPHYLFMSERHREALAHLLYGLDGGGGFVLLTGEIGAGKTTVCRCFLEQIPAHCNVAYIFNPKLTVTELLQAICDEFHVPVRPGAQTVKDYVDPLNAFLLAQHAAGRNNVLIIDEAQNLSADVLEQLRLLTNLETAERKLLQVVLIGQPELRGMLARPELEQLAQRVIARFHLGALSEAETAQYIRHRLNVAGLSGALPFDAASLRLIHQLARGVPRRINLLCDRALLGGYAGGQAQVTRGIVRQAAAEVFDAQHAAPATRRVSAPVVMGLAVLAAAVAGAGLTWGLQRPSRAGTAAVAVAAPAASSPASAASAAAPAASASSAASAASSAAPAPEPLRLADWTPRDGDAWAALAQRWGLPLSSGADPCTAAAQRGLQCYRSGNGSLSLIRLMDRPVLLTLQRPGQPSALAALVGLDGQQATLLVDGAPRRVALPELAGAWRGEFTTFWRVPPDYAHRAENGAALRDWLAAQLAGVPGIAAAASAPPGAAELNRQVQAFQASQGLQPDGRVGPITLMQINRATGVAEPRLDVAR
ncbi:AAA family ATPase [Roseateles sp.]|uniref:ExeA family protein n=1 Tax=Roseateles sp. TaxID=1971397 RepID=UPI0025E5A606|nr:AAA family ATPase [Roseateles sp.]MBV8037148.1 AAA family ATPase [Roseateles sp.]